MGGRPWAAAVLVAVITLTLLAMLVVPQRSERQTAALRATLRNVAEPARREITRVHVALAAGESSLRDFIETGDPASQAAHGQELTQVYDAVARLQQLSSGLGPEVDRWIDSLQSGSAQWRVSSELLRAGGAPGAERVRDSLHHEIYMSALLAAARLDEAIGAVAQRDRARIAAAERAGGRATLALGGLALTGVAAAAALGIRLRRYALEAERRRYEIEQVMDTKARMTRGLSHDLKNPLGAADGYAQLLEMGVLGELTDEQRGSVTRIRRAVGSVLALVNDILDLAAADSGELRIASEPADLTALVLEVTEEYQAAVQAAGLALVTDACADAVTTETDPVRVRQILGNLLSNAVKYTPAGGQVVVRVTAECEPPAATVACARVEVSDTGPGIPPDMREHVFAEFTRLHGGSTPGAGVGLTISRRLARLLGGDLRVEDADGGGACFVLTLPLRAPRAPA